MYVSKTHNALIVPRSPDIDNLFPDAKPLDVNGSPHAVLPHGIAETVMLRRLGMKTPNPMLAHYGWHGGTPFAVQKATCDMLTTNQRCYVLNDMGTGKTKAALWAWDYLNSIGQASKLLVMAPLSTLRFVWHREIFATLPHRKVSVLHGTKAARLKLLEADADIYVINHDGIKVIRHELAERKDIDCLVVDELAIFRNGSADRTKHLRAFARGMRWVWGMSGSPMPNAPTDVWAQGMVVNPTRMPKYFSHLRDELMLRRDEFHWDPKPNAIELAFNYLQPAVRFKLDDVVELPEVIERDIEVQLSTQQVDIYRKVANEFHAMAGTHSITAVNAGAALNKLFQISGGWVYAAKTGKVVHLPNSERMAALLDAIESSSKKVIIFAPFLHAVHGISEKLTAEHISHAVVIGATPNKEEIFGEFQGTNKYKALVAHPVCMSHGLTLTAADTIIWFLPILSLETYLQANARIRRVGQKHKQQILHIVGTPVERKQYRRLREKDARQDAFLTMFEDASILEV